MSTKSFLHEVMSLAWQFVRKNGFTMSEALKCAWANMKLKLQMKSKIVKFYFQKVDGSVREAYFHSIGTGYSEYSNCFHGRHRTVYGLHSD